MMVISTIGIVVGLIIQGSVMSIYSDKLAHIQVIINCRFSVAQMCTHEDILAHKLGTLSYDEVMSHNKLKK